MTKEKPTKGKISPEADSRISFPSESHQIGQKNILVVFVSGPIDMYTTPILKQQLQAFIQSGRSNIVVSLEKATFIGAPGLGTLLGIATAYSNAGGKLVLANATGYLSGIFRITKFQIPLFPSIAQAMKSF